MTTEEQRHEFLNITPIEELGLNTRAAHLAAYLRIRTIGAMAARTRQQLMRVPRFGSGAADHIERCLLDVEAALRLDQMFPPAHWANPELIRLRDVGYMHDQRGGSLRIDGYATIADGPRTLAQLITWQRNDKLDDSARLWLGQFGYGTSVNELPIEWLRITPRTYNTLKRLHIASVGALMAYTRLQLLRLEGCDEQLVRDVEAALVIKGIGLRENALYLPPHWRDPHRVRLATLGDVIDEHGCRGTLTGVTSRKDGPQTLGVLLQQYQAAPVRIWLAAFGFSLGQK